jgi:hypothetical protein
MERKRPKGQGRSPERETVSTLTQADLDRVANMPSRKAAQVLGVGKSTVNKYREMAASNGGVLPLRFAEPGTPQGSSTIDTRGDGSLTVETTGSVPQTKGEIDAAMQARGFNPEDYDFTYRFSEWEAQSAASEDGVVKLYAARAGATLKRKIANSAALDVTELLEQVNKWEFTPVIKDSYASADLVQAFSDPQFGKTDINGGTEGTVARVLTGTQRIVEIAKEERPRAILFGDLGDGLENFLNTAQQRETNDLDLTSQVRLLRRTQAECLRMLAPYCEFLIHASVPSNHGSVRVAFQEQASTVSNDWGLEVSHQLEDVFTESAITNLSFVRPNNDHAVSTAVEMPSGTSIGLTHGDQAGRQNNIGAWWMAQAFGWKNPLRDVDLLLYGHFHNQSTDELSRGRWSIGCASSDPGSAWFENRSGRSATSGTTTFLTADREFWKLQIV